MKWGISAMKSKISFFNPGIVFQDLRQYGWVAIIYTIGLLLTVPVAMLILTSSKYFRDGEYKSLADLMTNHLEVVLLFAVPVVAGVMVFRYLQTEASADYVHSFPIRRESLYVNHVIGGIVLLIVPILITTGVLFAVVKMNPVLRAVVTNAEIWNWAGIIALCSVFVLAATVFIGMMTGMSTIQAILSFIFLLLPFGLYELILYQMQVFMFGFYPPDGVNRDMLIPLQAYLDFQYEKSNFVLLIIYILLTILLFIAGWFLYKLRNLENAQEVIAYEFMRPIFKYGVTFCATLLGSAYFYSASGWSLSWHVFGAVVGALAGYFVSEMLMQKNWRVFRWKTWIGFICFSAVMAIVFTALATDALGYGKKVPEENEISGVRVFQNDVYWQDKGESAGFSEDRAYIRNTREFQKLIIQSKENENEEDAQSLRIEYKLKNGKLFKRSYTINEKKYKSQLRVLHETADFKKQRYADFSKRSSELSIAGFLSQKTDVVLKDPEDINQVKDSILQDLMGMTYNEEKAGDDLGYLTFRFGDEYVDINWNSSFEHLKNRLAEKNLLEQVLPTPDEINNMLIAQHRNDADKVEINRKDLIQHALENSKADSGELVFVRINYRNGNEWEGYFPKEAFPKEVTDQL
jgi:ABC-2 type transport system permease protein